MPDASTTAAALVALAALFLTVVRYRRNRQLGLSRGESLGRATWQDLVLGRNHREPLQVGTCRHHPRGVSVPGRLRQLDRRAETWGRRLQREYDVEPPWWVKYGGFVFILLGPASIPLSLATSPGFTMILLGALLVVYAVAVAVWAARHRS